MENLDEMFKKIATSKKKTLITIGVALCAKLF